MCMDASTYHVCSNRKVPLLEPKKKIDGPIRLVSACAMPVDIWGTAYHIVIQTLLDA